MVKKVLLVAGGLALLLGLFFGRDAVTVVRTSMEQAQTAVRESVPIKFELDRARKMIQDLDPEISRHKRAIAREELELQKLDRQVKEDEAKLAKSWADIQKLRGDLERGGSNFVYVGRTYTAKQVESDLAARFDRYQTKEATVENLQKILDARQRGLSAAQEKLKAMIAAKRQLEVEVENLEARQKMVEVAKASSEFNIDDSQLSRTRNLLNDIEARIEVDAQLVNADDVILDEIQLDEPVEDTGILDRISNYENAKADAEKFVDIER
jgi:Skp family chaperone for outer membrane proteins